MYVYYFFLFQIKKKKKTKEKKTLDIRRLIKGQRELKNTTNICLIYIFNRQIDFKHTHLRDEE